LGEDVKINKRLIILLLLCTQCAVARLDVLDTDPQNVRLIETLEMRFCYISFVEIDGQEYIVKQKKSDCIRKIGSVVRDAIMAHYAEGFINAHMVDIIPAGKSFTGKPRADWPATIHTVAKGKMIKAQDSRFNSMNIKQADIGFRRNMLPWMAKDPRLVKMVAYDTFFSNHDRHRGNLFYYEKEDLLTAIDMDSAFKYNLCALGCQNFTAMLNDRKLRLSNKEINILVQYKKYLEILIDRHNPQETLELYDYFTQKAGFVEGSELYTERLALELASNRDVIVQSYQDVQRLVKIVGKLIDKQKNL
jgi:hypothetical protein